MIEILNKNNPKCYVYRSETAKTLLEAVAEAHTLGINLNDADLSGLAAKTVCPHGTAAGASCEECLSAQAHTTSPSAPTTVIACPHEVPYPDPCLSCANEHLHAAADAPSAPRYCPHGVPIGLSKVVCTPCKQEARRRELQEKIAAAGPFGAVEVDDGDLRLLGVSSAPATAEATQVGGDHYRKMKIQPMRFSMENGLDACQHTVIKYVSRFRDKGGIADLEKAKHVIDLLIQFEKEKNA